MEKILKENKNFLKYVLQRSWRVTDGRPRALESDECEEVTVLPYLGLLYVLGLIERLGLLSHTRQTTRGS